MKKVLFSAVALALLAVSSCKKDDDNGPSNGWVLNGTSYNTVSTTYSSGILGAASSSPIGAFYASFGGSTPAAGTYKIVSSSPATNEVTLVATSSTTSYSSTGNGNVNATVTVNGSKITINFPDTWVKSGTDSVKLSGNVTQL